MKKLMFTAFILALTFIELKAQTNNTAKSEYTELPIQQNNNLVQVRAFKEDRCYPDADQWGQISMKNITSTKLTVNFDIVVNTVCGMQKTKHYFEYIWPGETESGIIRIGSNDCKGTLVEKNKSLRGDMTNLYNRIKGVGYANLTITREPADAQNTTQQQNSAHSSNSSTSQQSATATIPNTTNTQHNNRPLNFGTPQVNTPAYNPDASVGNNISAAQRTLDVNAPIRQAASELIDKYLVDKDELAKNPLKAASYEYYQKALTASTVQEQNTYNVTASVLGLLSLIGSNKTEQALSDEKAKALEEEYNQKINAARPYYLYNVQDTLSEELSWLHKLNNPDMNQWLLYISILNLRIQQLLVIKEVKVDINKFNGKIRTPDFENYTKDVETLAYPTVTWDSFKQKYYYPLPLSNYPLQLPTITSNEFKYSVDMLCRNLRYNMAYEGHAHKGKIGHDCKAIVKHENYINDNYANATKYLDLEPKSNIQKSYSFLKSIQSASHTIDTSNNELLKENFTFIKNIDSKGYRYYTGGTGLRKLHGMILLADIIGDSAIAKKDPERIAVALDKYIDAYHWFCSNMATEKSKLYDKVQYQILNGLFDNAATLLMLYAKYGTDASKKLRYKDEVLNNLLSYIIYSNTYFSSTTPVSSAFDDLPTILSD